MKLRNSTKLLKFVFRAEIGLAKGESEKGESAVGAERELVVCGKHLRKELSARAHLTRPTGPVSETHTSSSLANAMAALGTRTH